MKKVFALLLVVVAVAAVWLLSAPEVNQLDKELYALFERYQVNGKPEIEGRDDSGNQAMVALGKKLFFSPDLSLDGAVSCASCHHPEHAGGDGIALPVGIGGKSSELTGEERVKAAEAMFGERVLHGFIPRNTPTVFNSALYKQSMFWDGRIRYVVDAQKQRVLKTGFGLSPVSPVNYEQTSLLQSQARMPLTSAFEMKGGLSSFKSNVGIETEIIERLRTSDVWCEAFAAVFNHEGCEQNITLDHMTRVLAAYEASLTFVDNPFFAYVKGDVNALTQEQKKGALLFYKPLDQGGLGCAQCHGGNNFSDELFYNLAVPASGIGVNHGARDQGAYNVDKTETRFSFRTPSLLNISETFPYFHNGIAQSLEAAVLYHAKKRQLTLAAQMIEAGRLSVGTRDYSQVDAEVRGVFEEDAATLKKLPETITDQDAGLLLSFLQTLTDECVREKSCQAAVAGEVVAEFPLTLAQRKGNDPRDIAKRGKPEASERPQLECAAVKPSVRKQSTFTRIESGLGLDVARAVGDIKPGWMFDVVNYAGLSVMDVDYDCLDDVVIDAGANGVHFFRQQLDGMFQKVELPYLQARESVAPLIMDLDGDYKFDLFVGTLGWEENDKASVYFDFQHKEDWANFSALSGPVINASIADIDGDKDLDLALAFWRSFKSLRQPLLWMNTQEGFVAEDLVTLREEFEVRFAMTPDEKRSFDMPVGVHDLTFTPNFIDLDGDYDEDLLLASDFNRSQVLINAGGHFDDVTDKSVIVDDNGMGVAIADFDNNGWPDWYVTSILSSDQNRKGNWLYKGVGPGKFEGELLNTAAGEEIWSWGSCAKDFDNDGDIDIFYASGYGEALETARYLTEEQKEHSEKFLQSHAAFAGIAPVLLFNNGDGSFTDVSKAWGFTHGEAARGVSCFDYQQDGDIDILIANIEGEPVLYRNELNGANNWLAVRVLGKSPNTEAIGAVVELHIAGSVYKQQIRFENNYVSRNPGQLHFGLGGDQRVDRLVVRAPGSGEIVLEITAPVINQLLVLSL